jgi:hypothetical protein
MANAALEALRMIQRELAQSRAEDVPSDWKTAAQWAVDADQSRARVAEILKSGSAMGLVEKRMFRIACGQSGVRSVVHYRMSAKKK